MNDDYLAGFVDGEGCLTLTYLADRHAYRAYVSVSNTDETIIRKIRDYLNCGHVVRLPRHGNHRDAWQWTLMSKKHIVPLLERLIPKLYVKKQQAMLVMEFFRSSTPQGHHLTGDERAVKTALLTTMRALNQRGQSSRHSNV